MLKRGLLVLLVLLLIPFASAGDAGCDTACKSQGYEFGKCSINFNGCGPHGWVHYQANACGIPTTCCCANGYKSLDAAGLCDWLVNGNVHGGGLFAPYTCDKDNEIANYYCDLQNNLKLECMDYSTSTAHEEYSWFEIVTDPGDNYECLMVPPDKSTCHADEKVIEGDSDVYGYGAVAPSCGDNLVTEGEDCDSDNLNEKSCTELGFSGGVLSCSADCTFNTSKCTGISENCGNNVLDAGEQCDTDQLNGQSCESLGFPSGNLACKPDCTFDASGCNGGPCTDSCSPVGASRCQGIALEECMDHNDDGCVEWGVTEEQSEQCCTDGDCSQAACTANSGQWLPDADSPDFDQTGKCCGDDDSDYGLVSGTYLCTDSGWVQGVEGERYADNRILFCENAFRICFDDTNYEGLTLGQHCEEDCGYYCEPQFNKWLDSSAPEGLDILDEPLGDNETINSTKFDLGNGFGCCPADWCWNGEKCIENQEDEPDNLYVLNHPENNFPYRCIDGVWKQAKLAYSWDNSLKGYCPDLSECLVSYGSFEYNYQPDKYFSDAKPQCISDSQFILDNYCNEGVWVSRTSLLATKLLQMGGAQGGENFELFCDNYHDALVDYQYGIAGVPVVEYMGNLCEIGGQEVPCANNFCVFKNRDTGDVIAGTTVNVDLFDAEHGLSHAINVNSCRNTNNAGMWDYAVCTPNVVYNPELMSVIFSNQSLPSVHTASPWELFYSFLSNPIVAISDLVLNGELSYYSVTGIPLEFSVLNSSRLFSKIYISDVDGKRVEAAYEENIFDWTENQYKYYMIASYYGYPEDLCNQINNFTAEFGRYNCNYDGNKASVVESRESKSYLMGRWLDLTTKFIWRDLV